MKIRKRFGKNSEIFPVSFPETLYLGNNAGNHDFRIIFFYQKGLPHF